MRCFVMILQAVECFKRCQVNVDKLRTVAKGQGGTPGEAPDLGGIAAAEALIPTCEKWKEVCDRPTLSDCCVLLCHAVSGSERTIRVSCLEICA